MELIKHLFDLILHFDKYLGEIITQYGTITYIILFLIIFVETGLIVMPFLPGDSLLFVAGFFAANGQLNLFLLMILLFVAAFSGDAVNYSIGKILGERVLKMNLPFVKPEYFEKTNQFYEKYGSKTIIFARFIPIVRTFAPFVAGVGKMRYSTFFTYNLIGGAIWIVLLLSAGFFFGNIPPVRNNLKIVTVLIILISVLLPVFEIWKEKRKKSKLKN